MIDTPHGMHVHSEQVPDTHKLCITHSAYKCRCYLFAGCLQKLLDSLLQALLVYTYTLLKVYWLTSFIDCQALFPCICRCYLFAGCRQKLLDSLLGASTVQLFMPKVASLLGFRV